RWNLVAAPFRRVVDRAWSHSWLSAGSFLLSSACAAGAPPATDPTRSINASSWSPLHITAWRKVDGEEQMFEAKLSAADVLVERWLRTKLLVQGVARGDVLHLRRAASPQARSVCELAPDTRGLVA